MARPTVSADVLAQRGVPITLADDREVRVVYTFRSLMLLEERYGSIGAAVVEIEQGERGKAFTTIAAVLAAGLTHEVDADGAPMSDPQVVADYLDPRRMESYSDAIGEAFTKSFPEDKTNPTQAATTTEEPSPPVDSPGPTGTGSASSTSAEPTPSSGT